MGLHLDTEKKQTVDRLGNTKVLRIARAISDLQDVFSFNSLVNFMFVLYSTIYTCQQL